jgi:hypothetical protein
MSYWTLKFQIPSTKFQINLKIQLPLTKTIAAISEYCRVMPVLQGDVAFVTYACLEL